MGYGADSPGGRNEGAGGKPDKDKSDGGGNGKGGKAGGDGKDKGGNGGTKGNTKGKDFGGVGSGAGGAAAGAGAGPGGDRKSPPAGSGPPGTGSGTSADGGKQHYVDAIDDPAMKSWNRKKADEANEGESWTDGLPGIANELGWAAAGLLGLDEDAPDTFTESAMEDSVSGMPDPNKPTESAHVHFDPVQALANFAGLATGLPTGTAYGVGKWGYETLTGEKVPWDQDMGTSLFGGGSSTPASAGAANNGAANGGAGSVKGDNGGGGGKNNGLLAGQSQVSQQQQVPATPSSMPSSPAAQPPATSQVPSKFPKPTQKFQGASYWAGDWVYNPSTQQVEWKQAANGLLA